ncbi:DUF4179 domain-containing protein [Romboutsia sp. 1001713B170131_170501_G6]|uniref:DUF4179 domain-containing protein n=1 Tax=Romboutsia sp. 1001713B170131_170501_G6 TaxID=2787108 RepID=UPI0018AB7E4E|nr:DUF4179 domain-containing protein [Romboutsia sp. 1001713B170131_170501_G6]
MIDKYKVLNNEKIQFDRYDEVKTDNEKMKNIMKSKLKSRKQVNKKLIAASISATLVLGSVALTNETTWAYIDRLVNHIESFLDRDYGEFDKYKFEGNQSLEKDGLILNLGDVMLDDRQLIISLSMDYTNFDLEKHGFNKKDFMPDLPLITIGDMSFPGQGGGIRKRDLRAENKKEFLYTVNLTSIDTDGDGLGDTDFEILDNLKKNKDYDLKIKFKDFDIGESKTEKGRLLSKSFGNWEFNTTINSSNISSDVKTININKVIDISEGNIKCKLKIDEVRISPISVKVKTQVEGEISDVMYLDYLLVKDENGKALDGGGIGNSNGNGMYYDFDLKGSEKKITIIPVLHSENNTKYFEDEKIEIDIP